MARLKILQLRLTLTSLFSATHAFFSLSPFFPMICDWSIFFILVTLDLFLLLIHRDLWNSQKWQILISVNRDLDFFLFSEIRDQNRPLFFLVFVYGKGVQNTCRFKFTNIFFFNLHLYFRRHYHQISFALKQVGPVS